MKNIQTLPTIANISVRRFVFLTVATAGIYPLLWLNSTQNKFFAEFENKSWDNSLPVMMATIPSMAMLLMVLTFGLANDLIYLLALASYFATWVHWSFKIRYDLISYVAINYGFKLEIHPWLAVLLGPVYIIHCINKIPLEYGVNEALKNI